MLVFILWKKLPDNVHTPQMVCDEVQLFKRNYAANKHLTSVKDSQYYWTRENFNVDPDWVVDLFSN